MIRITIQVTNELYERLREEAFRRRISMAELVRRALERYFGGEQAPVGKRRGK